LEEEGEMNRVLLVVIGALALPSLAFAQIEQGDIRVSAGLTGLTYSEIDVENVTTKTTNFSITPGGVAQVGVAATELFECGLSLGVTHTDVEIESSSSDATTVDVGPYFALNFPVNDAETIVLSPVIFLGYSGLFSDVVDTNAFQAEFGGEAKFFVAKNASIDVGFFFAYLVGDSDVSDFDSGLDTDGFILGPRVKISIWP
jgi:hypothetical protein